MSRPSKLARTVAGWFASGFIYPHILATVQEAVVGLALGIVAGVVIGMLFAFFPFLSGIFHPLIVVFNATPRIALAPLFIVWLGIGLASKVAMVVSLVFFIIFFSTYAGLRDVDVNLVNHVRATGAPGPTSCATCSCPPRSPGSSPACAPASASRSSAPSSANILGADRGIGWIVQYGESLFDANMVISGLVVLMVFVATLDGSLGWLERRFSHWKQKPL